MKKFLSLLLAAAMLCTLLVGCGSKSDDSNGDYKPFVEVQGVSDDTILVGNTAATTGAYATVGVPFNAGMEAAFKAWVWAAPRWVSLPPPMTQAPVCWQA